MITFSSDIDLLKWEPVLFRELALPSQTLCQGSDGVLSSTALTSSGASFVSSGVAAGHVIYLYNCESGPDGCYEIVSVDSATQLTVSVVRLSADDDAVAPPSGSEISYRVSTFDPQAEEAAYSLRQYFGIESDDSETEETSKVLNQRVLRQATVFAVLSTVFAASAGGDKDNEGFWKKSLRYQKMFHTARVKVRLEIDTDSDNVAEQFHCGGTVRLRRI
ncbi:MAG: hypothetical protein KAJ46_05345 [Sedimentisphaerales bacterium]|nr:hypothetical protein [Sedimentisphaerales bacterium]